jgi:hypothetical protein
MAANKIRLHWDNADKTVLRLEFKPGWDWDEFQATREKARYLIECEAQPVSLIAVQMQLSLYAPPDLIPRIAHLHKVWHPLIKRCVYVAPQQFFVLGFRLLYYIDPDAEQYHHRVDTLAEAREMLNTLDANECHLTT